MLMASLLSMMFIPKGSFMVIVCDCGEYDYGDDEGNWHIIIVITFTTSQPWSRWHVQSTQFFGFVAVVLDFLILTCVQCIPEVIRKCQAFSGKSIEGRRWQQAGLPNTFQVQLCRLAEYVWERLSSASMLYNAIQEHCIAPKVVI